LDAALPLRDLSASDIIADDDVDCRAASRLPLSPAANRAILRHQQA
jgi:hypothetical protein